MNQIPWLDPDTLEFPPLGRALREPDGLLAAGGDLSPERLLLAYRHGIFPWYESGQPILWWSPDPRCVLYPADISISRSLARRLRRREYEVRLNTCFAEVLNGCSEPRADGAGTWITGEMKAAYIRLHQLGFAHSLETFRDDELVGGLYGLGLGHMFFGESMFSRASDASKVAMVYLARLMAKQSALPIDCQVANDHLLRMGATLIPREEFAGILRRNNSDDTPPIAWSSLPSRLPPW
ncbi:MAG: leucyl/phenylalanyl-tRNA--protein transferase [Pseudomonadota bacterium]